jgi:hypothetical protein
LKLSLKSFVPSLGRDARGTRTVCSVQSCPNKMLMKTVPPSRLGIQVGEMWYCSVDCFAVAARTRLAALAGGRVMEMPRQPRLPLGLVLHAKGFLTDEQLRLATEQSKLHNEEMEAVVLRLGLVNERQLAAGRAAQSGHPVCGPERIGRWIEVDLPLTLLRASSAAPMHYAPAAQRLLLGFVYRVDRGLLQALEQITGIRAEACFITARDRQEQMEHLTEAVGYQETVLEESMTPLQMARALGGFAVEVGAREANFTRCGDYLWARLLGRRGTLDVLFRTRSVSAGEFYRNLPLAEQSLSSLS